MFLTLFLLITCLMHYVCIAWTCGNTPRLTFGLKQKILAGVLTVLLGVFFILPHHMTGFLSLLMLIIGDMWLGILFIYFMFVMAALCIQLPFKLAKKEIKFKAGYYVIGMAAAVVIFSIYSAFKTPALTKLEILTDLPEAHDMKIVFIADTHFGETVTPSRAQKLTDQVNKLEPDIILFGGDIFEDTEDYITEFVQSVKRMKAKKGKFGVPGNHEYYRGVNKTMDLFRAAGIKPLQNIGEDAGPVTIIGVNDIVSSKIKKDYFVRILKNAVHPTDFNILLSHSPLYFEEAAQNKIGLMLSGHTHNGQIWPFKYFVRLRFKYINGLYHKDNSDLYVTSGTFYWGPALRFLTKNELVLITLKDKNYKEEVEEEPEEDAETEEPVKRMPVSYDDILADVPKQEKEPEPEKKEEPKPEPEPAPEPAPLTPAPEPEPVPEEEEEQSWDIQIVFEDPVKEPEIDTKVERWPEASEPIEDWSDVFYEPGSGGSKQKAQKDKDKTSAKQKEVKAEPEEEIPPMELSSQPQKEEDTVIFSDILIIDDNSAKKDKKSKKKDKKKNKTDTVKEKPSQTEQPDQTQDTAAQDAAQAQAEQNTASQGQQNKDTNTDGK